jgi:phage-related protein
MATTIGTAYVQILPSTEGISSALSEAMNGPAESAGAAAGQKAGSGFGSKLASAAKVGAAAVAAVAAAATAAVGAAVKGVADLTKAAVNGYADYEQLVGGVETLFGTGGMGLQEYADSVGKTVTAAKGEYERMQAAQETVLANADMAWQTAGMSANEYMETVTGMSASLIQSLGGDTVKAADYADMAIIDMSDNANKMGSSMESIQNAYSGFAKGNYTMLDNLKLGYGGTASEMQRLIEDAEKLDDSFKAARDENGDLAMSYADVVDAIHIVQTNMGITGTTAKEASRTISGSIGAMQSAWQNLITGLGKEDADLGGLIDNVISAAETVLDNILPVVDRVLVSIGDALQKVIPIVTAKLPEILNKIIPVILDNLPIILDGILQLTEAIMQQLPTLIRVLVPAIVQLTVQVVTLLIQYLPEILQALWDAIVTVLDSFGIIDWAEGVWEGIKEVFAAVGQWFSDIFTAAWEGIQSAWAAVVSFFQGIWDGIVAVFQAVAEWFSNLFKSASDGVQSAWDSVVSFFTGIWDGIVGVFEAVGTWFSDKFNAAVDGVKGAWDGIKEFFSGIWEKIKSAFDFSDALNWGRDLIQNFMNGIKEKWNNLKSAVSNVASGIAGFLHFSEPDEGPLSNFHTYAPDMMKLFAKGVTDNQDLVTGAVERAFNFSDVLASPRLAPQLSMAGGPAASEGSVAELRALRDDLRGMLDAMRGLRVVLDTGETVGALSGPLNGNLGQQYKYDRRGI